MMQKYLVTGANGFIGRSLCAYLDAKDAYVRGAIRNIGSSLHLPPDVDLCPIGNIQSTTDWRAALEEIDVVFHCAGALHHPKITDPAMYDAAITQATGSLARQAIEARVKRFIYISTSYVYGTESNLNPFSETQILKPHTLYGAAKANTEQALLKLASDSSMKVVIVRPPLVYGPGVKGNFRHLIQLVQKSPLLPLGYATHLRSFVGMDNLLDFLLVCVSHPKAAGQIFNVSDDKDMSTLALCQELASLMHKKPIILPIPPILIQTALKLIGREGMYHKMFDSLQLDISHAKTTLNWLPPFGIQEQLRKTINYNPHH